MTKTKRLIGVFVFMGGCVYLFLFVTISGNSKSSAYANSKQFENFQEDLNKANDYWAHNNLGSEYARNGQYEKAVDEYKKSIAIIENLPGESWSNVSKEKMDQINKESRDFKQVFARYGLIEALEKIGVYDEALQNVEWLIQNQKVKGKEELLKQKLEGMKQNLLQKKRQVQHNGSNLFLTASV